MEEHVTPEELTVDMPVEELKTCVVFEAKGRHNSQLPLMEGILIESLTASIV